MNARLLSSLSHRSAIFLLSAVWTISASGQNTGRAARADRARALLARSDFHGGLVVHAGVRDPALAIAIADAAGNALVHGLAPTAEALTACRTSAAEAGVYGRVSFSLWQGGRFPYTDDSVNLVLIPGGAAGPSREEVTRVLAPLGVAVTVTDGTVVKDTKPWPDDVDTWSHSRYDATGNAVSSDQRAGAPVSLQWEAWPRWNRGTKTSALVTAGGRIFYILDDSHFSSSARSWSLIARDANNGLRLWRHELPGWEGARMGKKVGPAQVNRRLVAIDKRVYCPLGDEVPVSVIDAETGRVLRTLEPTKQAEEFLVSEGILVALVRVGPVADFWRARRRDMRLVAVDPETGTVLWSHDEATILPMTLSADSRQAVFHDGTSIRSLDLKTGRPRWTSPPTGQAVALKNSSSPDQPGAEKATIVLAPQFAPTLVIYDEVVAFAGGRQINVVAADDGSELWRADYAPSNYSVPVDLFGFDGALWGPDTGMNMWRPVNDNVDMKAYDPLTGTVRKTVEGHYGFKFQHHRCHQMKVVGNTVVSGKAGIEFLDTQTGTLQAHHWIRGSCYYGVLPANGLLYVPPHNCACYVRAKLSGFMALRSNQSPPQPAPPAGSRLRRGAAYGQISARAEVPAPSDWPTYRYDAARSGRTPARIGGTDLLLGWRTTLGGRPTAPIAVGNRLYLAARDQHRLTALDAGTGEVVWERILDARIDSPPTYHQGILLCGCRDGSVRAFRAGDGEPVWRFLAAPEARLIVSHGQLESPWPVFGSALVINDTVYIAAGKSSFLDGGVRLYGLDPHTGAVKVERVLESRDEDGAQIMDEESVDGFRNDILASDGRHIFLRHQAMDLAGKPVHGRIPHLHSPDGFLSHDATSRLLWTFAPQYTSTHQGAFYDLRLSRALFPSGRILVEGDDRVYGYGQNLYGKRNRASTGGSWALFSAAKAGSTPLDLSAKAYRRAALAAKFQVTYNWYTKLPIRVWALVRTADCLFAAGARGYGAVAPAALSGKADGLLVAVDPADGTVLTQMPLPAMPVWDGMVATQDNLFLALANGEAVCLWPADSGRPGTPLTADAWRAVLPPVALAEEPGLAGRWRFDEGQGMLARDCSGRGHDAEVMGRWARGEFGNCLVASGSPQAAVIPDAPHLQFGTDSFTLALWVKVDACDARLLGKEAFPENWWVINLTPEGKAELVLGEGRGAGKTVRLSTATALPTDAWCHLVAVTDREAGTVSWYVNGRRDTQTTIPETMTDGIHADGRDISIPSSYKPFRGLMGDLRIYSRALEPAEAEDLHAEQAGTRTSVTFELVP